jgi:phosphohistidine phosphatase SixA
VKTFLVRHSVPDYEPDEDGNVPTDPPLTDEGRKIVEKLGEKMQSDGDIPCCIYASPKLRCQETAEILRDAFGLDDVKTVPSIDSEQSIRGLVLKLAGKGRKGPMIVSHHETIAHGLRTLPDKAATEVHADMFAQGEMRKIKVDGKSGKWKEKSRTLPSDLGNEDHY